MALIGPNGAGKTTFFNCVTGIYKADRGNVFLNPPNGAKPIRLNRLKPNQVTERGWPVLFQNIRLFQKMTVLENVMIGRHCRTSSYIFGAVFRTRSTLREERRRWKDHLILQVGLGLANAVNELAENLPYGAQRRLEIARALATRRLPPVTGQSLLPV